MVWVMLVVAVVVAALTVAAVAGRVDGSMGEPTSTLRHVPLPPGPLTESSLAALRFDTGLRGYRMSQVDDVIDRLRGELADRDDQLAVLRAVLRPPDTGHTRPVAVTALTHVRPQPQPIQPHPIPPHPIQPQPNQPQPNQPDPVEAD